MDQEEFVVNRLELTLLHTVITWSVPEFVTWKYILIRFSFSVRFWFSVQEFRPAVPTLTLHLPEPFPPVIRNKSRSKRDSLHGRTIVTGGNEDDKETMRTWFNKCLAKPSHFVLEKPPSDERQASASRNFADYQRQIEEKGFTVWDIQHTLGDTISIVLEDSLKQQKELSGHADFIISYPRKR